MQGDVTKRMLFLSDHPTDYVVYHFFENKTTSYSKEEVEKTYNEIRNTLTEQFDKEAYKTASADEYPNVIVIMSESWWYLDHTDPDKMVLSQDPFGPLKELGDKVSWGSASVNIFGGGTISSETEFLTGWNSKYFRNSISVVSDQTGRKNILWSSISMRSDMIRTGSTRSSASSTIVGIYMRTWDSTTSLSNRI